MEFMVIFAILLFLAMVFAYINYRFLKFPHTIGLMFIALIFSIFILSLERLGVSSIGYFANLLLSQIDFNKTLIGGILSVLLFAGALHVNLSELLKQKFIILVLSTLGVLLSTFFIGTLLYYLLNFFNFSISYIYTLLFGALISPTDPIAVMGILHQNKISKSMEAKIGGESLLNDGIGIVVFLTLLNILTETSKFSFVGVGELFFREAIGGIIFGLVIGFIAYKLLKSINNYSVEVLITLSLAISGYVLASALHLSAPLAIVVAGVFIGNKGREFAMSKETREHLDNFWELIDVVLNAILFLLIGLELILISFSTIYLVIGLIVIIIVLFSRFASVGILIKLFSFVRSFSPKAIKILTWGGIRGGISIALALSLPIGPERDLLLTLTYMVVIFSILVQGLTLKYLLKDNFK